MEKNRMLNTTDGWDKIVNENAARKAYKRMAADKAKQDRKLKKMWMTACGIAVLGLTYVILGMTGAVADWLASLVSISSIAVSSFVFGRYVETKKG